MVEGLLLVYVQVGKLKIRNVLAVMLRGKRHFKFEVAFNSLLHLLNEDTLVNHLRFQIAIFEQLGIGRWLTLFD
eukprot:7642134-Pyramimonas_sp.AAC.2